MMLTADEIRDMLLQMILGATGGGQSRWLAAIGDIEVLPLTMNPATNWRVSPRGTKRQREVIEAAVKLLREAEPYVQSKEGTLQ